MLCSALPDHPFGYGPAERGYDKRDAILSHFSCRERRISLKPPPRSREYEQ